MRWLQVAIKLVPEREVFMRLLMGQEQEDYESLKQDIKMFVSSILPVLDETYALLVSKIRLITF